MSMNFSIWGFLGYKETYELAYTCKAFLNFYKNDNIYINNILWDLRSYINLQHNIYTLDILDLLISRMKSKYKDKMYEGLIPFVIALVFKKFKPDELPTIGDILMESNYHLVNLITENENLNKFIRKVSLDYKMYCRFEESLKKQFRHINYIKCENFQEVKKVMIIPSKLIQTPHKEIKKSNNKENLIQSSSKTFVDDFNSAIKLFSKNSPKTSIYIEKKEIVTFVRSCLYLNCQTKNAEVFIELFNQPEVLTLLDEFQNKYNCTLILRLKKLNNDIDYSTRVKNILHSIDIIIIKTFSYCDLELKFEEKNQLKFVSIEISYDEGLSYVTNFLLSNLQLKFRIKGDMFYCSDIEKISYEQKKRDGQKIFSIIPFDPVFTFEK